MLKYKLLVLFFLINITLIAQNDKKIDWTQMNNNPNANFYDVQADFNNYWKGKTDTKGKGYKVFKRWEADAEIRVYPTGDMSLLQTNYENFLDWQRKSTNKPQNRLANNALLNTGNWTELGPFGSPSGPSPYSRTGAGRLNFLRFDPINSNTMYVGAPDGGLWKSTNSGTSWSTNTDFLSVIGCSDLCINPTNTNIMYLATGDLEGNKNSRGILKSTDGGLTWNPTALVLQPQWNFRMTKLIMDPNDPLTMIASSNGYVFKTTDGWSSYVSNNIGIIYDLEFKPNDSNIVYAAGTNIYKSTNKGSSWTQITTGLPTSNVQRIALGVSPANSNYVYALYANSTDYGFLGMYRSTDSGNSFTLRASTPNLLGWQPSGSDSGGQGFYDLAVAVSPIDAEIVTTGGVNHWQSTNGGTNWTNKSYWAGGQVHADVHDIVYLPGSGTTIFSCNDGGIHKSINNGTSWTDISNNLTIAQNVKIGMSSTIESSIVNGTQDNGTNLKNATNWTNIRGGDGGECFIDPTDDNTIYTQYVYGAFARYNLSNGTETSITNGLPTPLSSNFPFYSTWDIDPVNNNVLYAGGNSVLYKSSNKGNNWAALGSLIGTGAVIDFAVAPTNTSVIYVIKSNAVSKSVNSGVSFSNITSNLPVNLASLSSITVSNTDSNKIWVTFSGYSDGNKVFNSIDGGTSWVNISSGLPNLPLNTIVYTNNTTNDAIYVGADVGVYYFDNSLSAFTSFMTNLANSKITDLEIFYPTNKIRAATYGRSVWESPLNTTSFNLITAASGTNISCFGGNNGAASVEIVSGNPPYTYSWSPSGGNAATATNLSAGTYTITITDAANQTDQSSYNVTEPDEITATSTLTHVTSNGGNDGSIGIAVSGGINSYTTATNYNFTNAPYGLPGITAITYTDLSTITIPALPSGAVLNNAKLHLENVEALENSWMSDIKIKISGNYTLSETQLSSTGTNGTISPNPEIDLPSFPISTSTTITLSGYDYFNDNLNSDSTIEKAYITLNYNLNGYQYLWSNGFTTPSISNLTAGDYSVTITDGNGCEKTYNYTINETIICFPTGATGAGLNSSFGTTTLNRVANSDWIATKKNGYLVLESKTKGFVIPMMDNPETTIIPAVEGMVVYDSDDFVIKLYNGTSWISIVQSCN